VSAGIAASEDCHVVQGRVKMVGRVEPPAKIIKFVVIQILMRPADRTDQMMVPAIGDPLVGCRDIPEDGPGHQSLLAESLQAPIDADQTDAGVHGDHLLVKMLGAEMTLNALGEIHQQQPLWGDTEVMAPE